MVASWTIFPIGNTPRPARICVVLRIQCVSHQARIWGFPLPCFAKERNGNLAAPCQAGLNLDYILFSLARYTAVGDVEPACFAAVAVTSVTKCRLGTGAAFQLLGKRRKSLLLCLCCQCQEGAAVPFPVAALSVVGTRTVWMQLLHGQHVPVCHSRSTQPECHLKCLAGVVLGSRGRVGPCAD